MQNTESLSLRKCPFCGGKARIAKNSFEEYWVECTGNKGWCNVYPRTWNYETMDDVIEAWNRRCKR